MAFFIDSQSHLKPSLLLSPRKAIPHEIVPPPPPPTYELLDPYKHMNVKGRILGGKMATYLIKTCDDRILYTKKWRAHNFLAQRVGA